MTRDRPTVRTFKPRRRPLSDARAKLFDELAPQYCIDETGPPFDRRRTFGRYAPLVVEIGIGFGEALCTMAADEPGLDLVGIDVHTPGVAASVARLDEEGTDNARLVHGDAVVFLTERIPPESLAGIRLFFPDPWPKARHRHRRMVAEDRLRMLVDRLAPDGWIHVATDIDDYATHAGRSCEADGRLAGGPIERPASRPQTRYERKGLAAGRSVTDLFYRRVSP